jgi:sensor c-di-GMP phosphodiesterase-like protein
MRKLQQRALMTVTATVAAAACGMLAGYLLGSAIVLNLTKTRLEQYANRILAEGVAASIDARVVLSALNNSTNPACSDADMALSRSLIFKAEYLKDAGRIRDGKIICSATMGSLAEPLALPNRKFLQSDGGKVYENLAPPQEGDIKRVGLQMGDSYIVFSGYALSHLGPSPMHYTVTNIDVPDRQAGRILGELPQVNPAILSRDGDARSGNTLYATRCSARYFDCVTAYISIPEALSASRGEVTGYFAMGGLIGACFGIVYSLLHRRRRSMEQQLRRAIRKDELRVVYQPIVDLSSRRIVGAEALARWTDEDGFGVTPDVFITIAEDRGFVGAITELVVRHALRDFAESLRVHPDFRLSINVAAADLRDTEFLPMLGSSLKRAGVRAQSVSIEITESSTARQQPAVEAIHCLRDRGHSVHVDDFGTGYSSLAYLHDLSVDAIKIDRAFTNAIGTEAVTVSILPQILAMADSLKLQVIVEGIETAEQASYFAASAQPVLAQGWFFGRPVPAGEFHRIFAEDEKDAAVLANGP